MCYMMQEIKEQPNVLLDCLFMNVNTINSLVQLIKEREIEFIIIAARGTSDHAAVYAKYVFEYKLGIPVSLSAPSIFTVYESSLKMKNCLVIGISQSGKAADVLEVIKAGNREGAITVSITNFIDSPLALESQFHLYCSAGLEKSVAATKTFTSQMYLIANLAAEWSGDTKMQEELAKVPEELRNMINDNNIDSLKIERYRYMNECFVLARGINYAIALEGALKIQETTYVRAKAYATSDFYHGPYAMIEKDMPVMVFAPDGPTLSDMIAMIKKLKESGAEIIIITNRRDLEGLGASSFIAPHTKNDIISPFYNVTVAQLFACKLALIKGLNPDAPRSLNKVTVTK